MKKAILVCFFVLVVFGTQFISATTWRSRVWPQTPEGVLKPHYPAEPEDPEDPVTPLVLQGWVIVIDPGHGGTEPGAINNNLGLKEKDINLSVGLLLRDNLLTFGADVKMTRSTDVNVTIAARRNFSNSQNAHRFVSLHVNAAGNTSAKGIETWVDTDAGKIWKDYAQTLHNNIVRKARSYDSSILDRKLKYSGSTPPWSDGRKIGVLRYDLINAPAALIEMNFISNDVEANRLSRTEYQKTLADGIAEGFVEHSTQYNKEDGVIKR